VSSFIKFFAEYKFNKPYRLAIVYLLIAPYIIYATVTETGLFLLIAELQLSLIGRYYLFISGILAFLAIIAPLCILEFMLINLLSKTDQNTEENLSEKPETIVLVNFRRYLSIFFILTVLSVTTAVFSGPIVRIFFKQEKLSVLYLNESITPKTLFVDLRGQKQKRYTLSFSTTYDKYSFIPMTSRKWDKSIPVTFFIKIKIGDRYTSDADTYKLSKNSLPGVMKSYYKKNGLIIAEPHFVAKPAFHSTSEKDVISYVKFSSYLFGFFFMIMGITLSLKSRLRLKR